MKTKPSRRTGLAGVLASAVAAGIMASRSGNAIVPATLRRNVRRGRDFFVMKLMVISSVQTRFHIVRLTQISFGCDKENQTTTELPRILARRASGTEGSTKPRKLRTLFQPLGAAKLAIRAAQRFFSLRPREPGHGALCNRSIQRLM